MSSINRNLESLLRWGIENQSPAGNSSSGSSGSTAVAPLDTQNTHIQAIEDGSSSSPAAAAPAAPKRTLEKLDPGIIDAILGKSDATRMLECVRDLKSDQFSHEQKIYIWDELELLVENLDNANDLENMKLWQPIYSFLADEDLDMRLQACWVLGTAIQNNPRSQTAFLALDPLPRILELLRDEESQEMRSKAMYTLSGALRHHPIAVERFTELGGWSSLASSLHDPSIALRRKTAFLINSLFANTIATQEAVKYATSAQDAGIQDILMDSLSKESAIPSGPNGDVEEIDADYDEKAIQALVTMTDKAGVDKAFKDDKQLEKLRKLVKEVQADDRIPSDIAQSEWGEFVKAVAA